MAIIEFRDELITHKYLMHRTTSDLCYRYQELTGQPVPSEFKSLLKSEQVSRLLKLYRELPND